MLALPAKKERGLFAIGVPVKRVLSTRRKLGDQEHPAGGSNRCRVNQLPHLRAGHIRVSALIDPRSLLRDFFNILVVPILWRYSRRR